MRLLLVTHYFSEHRSGIALLAAELARRLAARGVSIEWMASGTGQGDRPDGSQHLPVRAWNITERRFGFPYPLWGPLAICRLHAAVARCDIVHLHDALYMGNVAAYLMARRAGKPVVVTQHIGAIPYSSSVLRGTLELANRALGRLVLGGADRCIFISPQVQKYFAARISFSRPPLYIPNGVDQSLFSPVDAATREALRKRLGLPQDRPVLLFVGRFVEKKGLRFLHRLAKELPEMHWLFIGWGPEDPAAWGLAQVHCVGTLAQEAIADYYRAADLFVLPSVGEGFPLVVQEAMACGLPACISAETAEGAPEVNQVLDCLDLEPQAWVAALRRIVANRTELEARRSEVVKFARRWCFDSCADRYLELFQALTSASASRTRDAHSGGRLVPGPLGPLTPSDCSLA
jgi:glycosyltransferase involved in cell wall biosynthesis